MQRNVIKQTEEFKMDLAEEKISAEKFKLFGDEKARWDHLLEKEFNCKNNKRKDAKDY